MSRPRCAHTMQPLCPSTVTLPDAQGHYDVLQVWQCPRCLYVFDVCHTVHQDAPLPSYAAAEAKYAREQRGVRVRTVIKGKRA